MTMTHNSCKTCNIATSRLYGHLHVMLVTVCGYEQNPSRGLGGVAHTRFRVIRTDIRLSANLNAHPQFCRGHKKQSPAKK